MDDVKLGSWTARALAAGGLALFLCWQHVQATRLGYRVEAARKESRQRGSRVAALRVELEQRVSPGELAARASRLGLVPASPEALRRLPERGPGSESLRRALARRLAPLVAAARS